MAEISTSETWEKLLAGERPAIVVDRPQPGYYKRRLVKGGPWVAVRIWIEEERDEDGELLCDQKLLCLVDGKEADAYEQWPWVAGRAIPEHEYRFMVDDAAWCRKFAPDDPKANPTKPINLRTTTPVTPPKRSE